MPALQTRAQAPSGSNLYEEPYQPITGISKSGRPPPVGPALGALPVPTSTNLSSQGREGAHADRSAPGAGCRALGSEVQNSLLLVISIEVILLLETAHVGGQKRSEWLPKCTPTDPDSVF